MNEKADAGRTGFDGGEGSASVSSASVTAISEKSENTGRGKAGRRVFTRSERRGMFREAVSMAWPAVLESFFTSLAGMIDTMMVSSMGSYAVAALLRSQCRSFGARGAPEGRKQQKIRKRNAHDGALSFPDHLCSRKRYFCRVGRADSPDCGEQRRYARAGKCLFPDHHDSAQRGSGNTRISMTTNVASSITNICFNYCLIGGHFGFPALGCTGAAIATVLGTVVGAAMSFGSLFMKKSYVSLPYIRKEKIRPKHYDFKIIGKLSSNMLAENLLMRIGFLVTAFVAARIGTDAFAAHNVGMNLLGLSFSFADGMQAAGVALSGQALGANKKEEAKLYGKICQKIGAFISACIAVILLFGGRGIFRMFFDDPAILDMGVMISRYICVITFFQISQVIYGACLRAAGDVRYTLIASTISVTLIRSAMTILLVYMLNLGLAGIWLGVLSDQLSRYIFMSIRFRQGKWVNNKF